MNYDDDNRGKIQNRERARQIIDFSGIKYKNITPTDIDGFIEFQNKAYIFYEFKLKGVEIPRGQRVALELAVDDLILAGKQAVCFLCEHEEINAINDINAAGAIVKRIYFNKKWINGKGRTAREATDAFLNWVNFLNGG